MTPRGAHRTEECNPQHGRTRLRQAELYLEVAQIVLGNEDGEEATVATGNAVLAGIAAADAICCALAGRRSRGSDHRRAANYLEEVTGNATLAALFRELVDLKDLGHYGLSDVRVQRAKSAVRKATRIIEEARERLL